MRAAKSQTLSLGLHLLLVAMGVFIGSRSIAPPPKSPPSRFIPLVAPFRPMRQFAAAHGGGSNQMEAPARRGVPPARAHKTFVLPDFPREPKLSIAQTVAFTTPAPDIQGTQIGDPFSRYAGDSLGRGGGHAIGTRGCCGGIGDSTTGPPGFGSERVRGASPPRLVYKIEPEFSEEARKAKYQGTVILAIEVDASGHPRAFRVVRGLGLGLDEKAIEAVAQWRFQPGYFEGKPVVTGATIYVSFHLL